MQNGARYQAILELITDIFNNTKPADNIINEYIRARKYIGSKDRRFICEEVWNIIRNRLKLEFDSQNTEPRKILLWYLKDKISSVFDECKYGLQPLSASEQKWLQTENNNPYPPHIEAECPQWLFNQINNLDFCKELNKPASSDFRAHNHSPTEVINRLHQEGIEAFLTPYSPKGFRLSERLNINNLATYQDGWFEVQDEASQIAAILCDVKPEHKIIDYCCGAGGKSLALSDILHNQGKILAHDISSKRLDAIKPRITRLGIKNIELTDIIANSDKNFDRFIIDAPCSGTGTWRRAPDAKFRLSPTMLKHLNKTQLEILEIAVPKVKSGGRIIYITCSVLKAENEDIIYKFTTLHPEFSLIDISKIWHKYIDAPYPHHNTQMLRMSPLATNTDGFFICILQKQ